MSAYSIEQIRTIALRLQKSGDRDFALLGQWVAGQLAQRNGEPILLASGATEGLDERARIRVERIDDEHGIDPRKVAAVRARLGTDDDPRVVSMNRLLARKKTKESRR
jgi:hypothetical protein